MTTTLHFGMFSFKGNKAVEKLALEWRNAILDSERPELVYSGAMLGEDLSKIGKRKGMGEADDTAVWEAVYNYIMNGVKTVDFGDGDVRNFPPTLTPADYGILDTLVVSSYFIIAIFNLGLDSASGRYFFKAKTE